MLNKVSSCLVLSGNKSQQKKLEQKNAVAAGKCRRRAMDSKNNQQLQAAVQPGVQVSGADVPERLKKVEAQVSTRGSVMR